ncbi:hypothetical protein Goarm_022531 [Gossypium armourianum]|uniref:DUF7745 domain-containing protein n=1 Tax=Gossypium armourianum TaxID=34283 RepID=A0A7J9KHM1_9ROSI|nr:hypothetical protein [Gossypium armourianum]
MENEFLDKVEDNTVVRVWSEKIQLEMGDNLAKGYASELQDYTRISVTQNTLQELKEIWDQWSDETKHLFYSNYGDLPYLFDIKVDKAYSRAAYVPDFWKKLINITGMRYINKVVTDLFDWLDKRVTPVPVILAETFRSLNAWQKMGEGRFIGCAQLLLAWFHSHCWKVDNVSYRVFSKNYSPLKEMEGDIEWRALWLLSDEILYRCGDFDWVPLLGIWGAIGYAPLLVLRQYKSRQFIPSTQRLAEYEFSYKGDGYKKKIREMSNAWNQTHQMKRLVVGPMTTTGYNQWWVRRLNDNIPKPSQGNSQSMEEHLQVVPSELETIRQDFE